MNEDTIRICLYNRNDMLFSGIYEVNTIKDVKTTRKVIGYGASDVAKPKGLLEYINELKQNIKKRGKNE